jgi:hypothetical protein
MRRRLLLAAIGAPLLIGSVRPAPPQEPVEIMVSSDRGDCLYLAQGRAFNEKTLARAARKWRKRGVRIVGGLQAPYKCTGHAVFILQRAGHSVGGY